MHLPGAGSSARRWTSLVWAAGAAWNQRMYSPSIGFYKGTRGHIYVRPKAWIHIYIHLYMYMYMYMWAYIRADGSV